jgi:hypothetical protein
VARVAVEEALQRDVIVGVEGGGTARADLERGSLEPLDNGLAAELRLALGASAGGRGRHDGVCHDE